MGPDKFEAQLKRGYFTNRTTCTNNRQTSNMDFELFKKPNCVGYVAYNKFIGEIARFLFLVLFNLYIFMLPYS